MIRHITLMLAMLAAITAAAASPERILRDALEPYRTIPGLGVAVITDAGVTAGIRADSTFTLAGLVKFHQAVAMCRTAGFDRIVSDSVLVEPSDLRRLTWSPMRAHCPRPPFYIGTAALLDYSLRMSDNNAADILFRSYGTPLQVDSVIRACDPSATFSIHHTEAEIAADTTLARLNSSTPAAAAQLMHRFFTSDTTLAAMAIRAIMSRPTPFGAARIRAGLPEGRATLYNRTGTGALSPDGYPVAVNDLGFVYYPRTDGTFGCYTLAVFISGGRRTTAQAEAVIADISRSVFGAVSVIDANRILSHATAPPSYTRRNSRAAAPDGGYGVADLVTDIIFEVIDRAIFDD
ncbi:MAG: class A beta-lactamase-related serine hydrolase [Muribaculaceae bacterium]|nr:class A beta-lactamase-related serine hydrolase [Muribaculaceae bacterium]